MAAPLTLTLGLATYRALTLLYGPSAEWLKTETHPYEIALLTARAALLATARVTKWKARVVAPADAASRALLAEDLRGWALPAGLIEEFETDRPNVLIRGAFLNMADQLVAA